MAPRGFDTTPQASSHTSGIPVCVPLNTTSGQAGVNPGVEADGGYPFFLLNAKAVDKEELLVRRMRLREDSSVRMDGRW